MLDAAALPHDPADPLGAECLPERVDVARWADPAEARISHPVDRTVYGAALWSHVLRDQLDVAENEFWACVLDAKLPDRGVPAAPKESLPADLVYLLIPRVGLSEGAV
ncbi:MAG: hypothetical protein JF621_19940, partial [Streptomyces turgidiscabies]|nr:hypothetical protein [Streptomyces turgidiscabies]